MEGPSAAVAPNLETDLLVQSLCWNENQHQAMAMVLFWYLGVLFTNEMARQFGGGICCNAGGVLVKKEFSVRWSG